MQVIIKPQKFFVKFSMKIEILKNSGATVASQDPILFPPLIRQQEPKQDHVLKFRSEEAMENEEKCQRISLNTSSKTFTVA